MGEPDMETTLSAENNLVVTQRDMLGAMEVLTLAETDPDVFLVLTDEEILGLDGRDALEMLGGPYLAQEGVDAENAARSGVRSLAARKMLIVEQEGREDEGEVVIGSGDASRRSVQLQRRLAGILTLRRIPEAMLTAVRELAGGPTTLAYYFFPEGGVLEEFVSIDGFHNFSLPVPSEIPARLRQFVDPFETAADQDGEVVDLPAETPVREVMPEDVNAFTVVTSMTGESGRSATVIGRPDSIAVIDGGALGQGADEGTGSAQMAEVSRDSLEEILTLLLPVVDDEDRAEFERRTQH